MQKLSVTRRFRIGGIEPGNMELRAELFRTLTGYGVIEEMCFEEDSGFHSGAAITQFQRLSSSERMQNDMEGARRQMVINFLSPVMHVGSDLFVTSPKPIDVMYLRSLISQDNNDVLLEEKILCLPGAVGDEDLITLDGTGRTENKSAAAKDVFDKALILIKARAIGRFALLMTFSSVCDANNFLTAHQMFLAASKELYVVHIGSNIALQNALKEILLTRRASKDLATGSVLRGVVLPPRKVGGTSSSNGNCSVSTCEVDAGLTRKGRPILLRVQRNFIKVVPWETVEVRVTSLDPGSCENFIDAVLRGVVNVNSAVTESQKPAVILNRLRQQGGSSVPSLSSPFSSSFTTATSNKDLAGKLYQALHARNKSSKSIDGQQRTSGDTAERVHKFPQGFHIFSVVSVCVQRIGEDGLYARMIPKQHGESQTPCREWAVFVPSFFIPKVGGMIWQEFAVPGERMTVVLLFAAAVGGSEAALRFVASKRETDMRRASSLVSALAVNKSNGGNNNDRNGNCGTSAVIGNELSVGAQFSASRAVWLPQAPGIDGPVFILLPSSAAPESFFSVSIFLRAAGTASAEGSGYSVEAMTADAGLHCFVIADILHDNNRGYYALAEEEVVYRQKEGERRAAEALQESKRSEFVKRILSEMLPAGEGESSAECRKRPRSPDP